MITLEEQIRRYATDVAGPAVGAPPEDLVAAGGPRRRGRWALVAALVVFIAGLAWLATRPSELGGSPVVDTIATPTTTTPPVDAISLPGAVATCNRASGDLGVTLAGPQGAGLCVAVNTAFPPDPVTGTMLTLWDSGRDLGGIGIPDCTDLPVSRSAELSWRSGPDGAVLWTTVSRDTATVRLRDGEGPTLVAFSTPGFDTVRFIAARVTDVSWLGPAVAYDAAGVPLPDGINPVDHLRRCTSGG